MALPKGKISKARKHSRRANWKLTLPGIGKCPQCGQMKLSHRVCKNCGYYNGVQVVVNKDEEKNALRPSGSGLFLLFTGVREDYHGEENDRRRYGNPL